MGRSRNSNRVRIAVMTGVLLLTGAATLFGNGPTPRVAVAPLPLRPAVETTLGVHSGTAHTLPDSVAHADFMRRYRQARAAFKWAGDIHHLAMVDGQENRSEWRGNSGTEAFQTCRATRGLIEKYAQVAEHASGGELTGSGRAALVDAAVRAAAVCEAVREMRVFSRGPMKRRWSAIDTLILSGNLVYYEDAIEETVFSWNGVSDLSADVDAAMQSIGYQYLLTQDDTDIIGGLVEFTLSSVNEWAAHEYPGNTAWDLIDHVPPSSVFHRSGSRFGIWRWLKNALTVAASDFLGAKAGIEEAASVGCPSWCVVMSASVFGAGTSYVAAEAIDW